MPAGMGRGEKAGSESGSLPADSPHSCTRRGQQSPTGPEGEQLLGKDTYLQQARDDIGEELQQGVLGNPLHNFGLHLDGGEVDGVVCCLDDGAEHFDALLWVDRTG